MNKATGIVLALIASVVLFNNCSGNNEVPNYSAQGACKGLESLINQLGMFEISDTENFYSQMNSIISQARSASARDSKFSEMANQVESFLKVFQEKYPTAVPNYLGSIPLQVTADEFCGTEYSKNA